jgi:hypothetical protein
MQMRVRFHKEDGYFHAFLKCSFTQRAQKKNRKRKQGKNFAIFESWAVIIERVNMLTAKGAKTQGAAKVVLIFLASFAT